VVRFGWLVCWYVCWLVGWLVNCLFCRWVSLLVEWLLTVGQLTGLSFCCYFGCLIHEGVSGSVTRSVCHLGYRYVVA